MQNKFINYKNLDDLELVNLLFTEKDQLPREAVDEFVNRGERMIPWLWGIIKEIYSWNAAGEKYWAPIHAAYIIGAISGKKAVKPLIMSLKFSDLLEVDWLWDYFPAMFGKIGLPAIEPLKAVVLDDTNNWMTRSLAADGLAAITIEHQGAAYDIFNFIAGIAGDEYEDIQVRTSLSSILLDFKQKRYEKILYKIADEEDLMEKEDPEYIRLYDKQFIEEELNQEKNEKDLINYQRDWLKFYDPAEIKNRQKRWKEENSMLWKIPVIKQLKYLDIERKVRKDIKKMEEKNKKDK